ncbi:MAG TPA: sterol desaturase family protein [Polyangiaceae bacterium]|nr:sterol desaturase family protein [Polyangiaceae bacterium]
MPTRLDELSYAFVYVFTVIGFVFIYFTLGFSSEYLVTRVLPARGQGAALSQRALAPGQKRSEIVSSLRSISLFGGYGVFTLFGWRHGLWGIAPATPVRVWLELVLLVLWNELHFYVIHRALHVGPLFRWVHREHHRAIRPTSWSTFAMHPLEAILLGSVMVTAMPFHAFSWLTLLSFPLVSLALNNIGHMNYDVLPGASDWHPLSGSRRHELHHRRVHGNYGFMLPLLDRLFRTELTTSPPPTPPSSLPPH